MKTTQAIEIVKKLMEENEQYIQFVKDRDNRGEEDRASDARSIAHWKTENEAYEIMLAACELCSDLPALAARITKGETKK